jgi:hypothetical protein
MIMSAQGYRPAAARHFLSRQHCQRRHCRRSRQACQRRHRRRSRQCCQRRHRRRPRQTLAEQAKRWQSKHRQDVGRAGSINTAGSRHHHQPPRRPPPQQQQQSCFLRQRVCAALPRAELSDGGPPLPLRCPPAYVVSAGCGLAGAVGPRPGPALPRRFPPGPRPHDRREPSGQIGRAHYVAAPAARARRQGKAEP